MRLGKNTRAAAVAVRNLILGGNLLTLALLPQPQQMMLYVSENLFLFKALLGKRGIPQKNVFEVLGAGTTETIRLGNLTGSGHWLFSLASYTADLVNLSLICQILKPMLVFEIGTLNGYTALQFALNTPENAKVYTLDLPGDARIQPSLDTTASDEKYIRAHSGFEGYLFDQTPVFSKITCLFGDSAVFDFSPFYGKVDFFFIDGSHSYDYVRSDTLNALKCCHPGSVIAWHDFGRVGVNGVSKWILELQKTHSIYSIPGGSVAFMVV